MKGKKLITWLLSAVLITGGVSPVYGAGDTVGAVQQVTDAEDAGTDLQDDDASSADAAENETALKSSDDNSNDVKEDTDAFPDSVTEAAESSVGKGQETGTDAKDTDDSSSMKKGGTDSLTDSLPTDSSTASLLKEQETLVGSTYTSAVPEDGKTYYIRCAANRDLTLTVSGSSAANQGNIVISKLTKTYDQKFMCRKLSDGTYAFSNFYSGKALRVAGNSAKNGANIWQYEFNSAGSGRWKLVKNSDGSYRIASNMNTNYVLDVYAGSVESGTNVWLYKWNKTNAQKFVFTETPIPDYEGTLQLRPENASAMCVAPVRNSASNGSDIQLAEADNAAVLTYNAVRQSAGYYVLLNKSNGLALTVQDALNKSGANIVQQKRTNSFAQQWLIRKNADGSYSFLSRLNSCLALTPDRGGTTEGTTILLSTDKGYTSQKYYHTIITPSPIPHTEIYIRSCVNSDRVIDVQAAGTADGTNIDCYDWNETAAQRFKMETVTAGGKTNYWYKISSVISGKVLEVAGESAREGANIQLGTYRRTKGQLWHPVLKSDGTYLLLSGLNTKFCMEMTGSEDYGANVRLATSQVNAKQKWYLSSVRITGNTIAYSDHDTVTVRANGTRQQSDTGLAYLFAIAPTGKTIKGYTPLASAPMSTSYIFHASLNLNNSKSLLQRKFYIATMTNGIYRIISNGFYIQNPQAAATNTKAFPTPARGTKKALKTLAHYSSLIKDLNCSHVVLDFPLEHFLYGNKNLAFRYEGITYYFDDRINTYADRIKTLNKMGVVVTGIFYLSNTSQSDFMYPSAASGSLRNSATIFALNTKGDNRKRLEALFACLADKWTTNGVTMANWIYGNELQNYSVYHYAGDVTYNQYHEILADEFRMFNACIKSRWSKARTYISLDHNWNLSWNHKGSYNGMALTADFNTDLIRQGQIHWDMAMHPYPSPEQDCQFWERAHTVTNSGDSQQITMLNARYFSSYIKSTYGSATHVIMSETGLSSVFHTAREGAQAASVAFAYYLAEFDPNIDMICIHRDYDNSGEMAGGWHLGIFHENQSPKPAADVFKYMDTKNWDAHVTNYMNSYIGSNWKSQIRGFDANFFKNK